MKPNRQHEKIKGFTLIELLVSVAIIGVLTAVVVFNQGDFSDRLALSNNTSEIELQIRQAQVYGVSVREFSSDSEEFRLAYGVNLIIGGSGASNSAFIYFADRGPNANGYYSDNPIACSPGPTKECLARTSLTRGNIISNICVIQSDNTEACGLARTDITFIRPNPDARIKFFNSGGVEQIYANHRGVKIELRSPKLVNRSVYVYTTGQVAIQ